MNILTSKCCGEIATTSKAHINNDNTAYYVCTDCKKPCDICDCLHCKIDNISQRLAAVEQSVKELLSKGEW